MIRALIACVLTMSSWMALPSPLMAADPVAEALAPAEILIRNNATFTIQIAVGGTLQGCIPPGETRRFGSHGQPAPASKSDVGAAGRHGGWPISTTPALSVSAIAPDGHACSA